jgi:hypothetical protein
MKTMELMQRMTAEQKRGRIARLLLFETGGDAFGEGVVAGIIGGPRPGHELVAELLEGVTLPRRLSGSLLEIGNRAIDRLSMPARRQRSLAGDRWGRMCS